MTARKLLTALATLALFATSCGDDGTLGSAQPPATASPASTATTSTTSAPPTTPPPTATPATTTTTAAPTTTSTTTTVPPFNGTVDSRQADLAGTPDARLVDVRIGSHPGFTRVVWEMDGSLGTPGYMIGYTNPPFENIGGFTVPVAGSAFLHVVFFPGMRYDISDPNDIIQTYLGPETITVGTGSVQQVVFVEDFEATMEWVVGLTEQRPFTVFTLENPTRLVVDIAD